MPLSLLRRHATILLLAIILLSSCSKDKPQDTQKPSAGEILPPKPVSVSVSGIVQKPEQDDHSGILVYALGKSLTAYTARNGSFTFLNVPPGDYEFEARFEGHLPQALGSISIGADHTEPLRPINLSAAVLVASPETPPLAQVGGLMGRVELENGAPATGVLVQIEGTPFRTVCDEEGLFRFFNIPPRAYVLTFSFQGFVSQSMSINVAPGAPSQAAAVRMLPVAGDKNPRRIYGAVEMYDLSKSRTNKFDSVIIALEGTSHVALLDSEGKFVMNGVPPGKYVINAVAPGFLSREKLDIDLMDIEYTNVGFILDEQPSEGADRSIVKGNVLLNGENDHSGVTVALAGTSKVSVSDAEGHFSISDVPPGEYTLIAQYEGYVPVFIDKLEVNPSEEVQVTDLTLDLRVFPPRIIYTEPDNGQTDILVQKAAPLFVRFSKQMKPESIRRAFSIRPPVKYRLFTGRESRFSDYDLLYVELLGSGKDNPLQFDTRYSVSISTAARDFEDLAIEEPYEFTFTTGRASVTGSRPERGETGALVTQQRPALVFFNAPIDLRTISDQTVTVSPPSDDVPRLQVNMDPETGWSTLRIYMQLKSNTQYTVNLSSRIMTEGGSSISNLPYSFTFRSAELRDSSEIQPRN